MDNKIKNKQIVVTSDFDVSEHNIINLNEPINDNDAATKIYVDDKEELITVTAGITVGGISINNSFVDKTNAELWDILINPTLYPTLTPPTSTFSITSSTRVEIGSVITIKFKATFNRGSISPQYDASSVYRSGLPNKYNFDGNLSNIISSALEETFNLESYTVLNGTQSWHSTVDYDAGVSPTDSKGASYDKTALIAGTTSSKTASLYGVYPWYGTTIDVGTLTKQSLKSMTTVTPDTITFVAEDGINKQQADFPLIWNNNDGSTDNDIITSIEYYDTSTEKWKEIWNLTNLNDSFIVGNTTHTVQGISIYYKTYTNATSGNLGARKLRFS